MSFIHGHTYRLFSVAYPSLALNVYGTNAASTGRNVCLYDKDENPNDPMQKWYVTRFSENDDYGFVMRSVVNNTFVLDRSDGSVSTSYNNNAHLCKETSTTALDCRVEPINVQGNVYRICLPGRNLYLTAANDNGVNPTSSITTQSQLTGANKNVYWATAATTVGSTAYNKQCWTVIDLSAGSSGNDDENDNPYADLDWRYVFANNSIKNGNFGYDPDGTEAPQYHEHYGIDVLCDEGTALYAPANATVYAVGAEIGKRQTPETPNVNIDDAEGTGSMGYFIVLKMNDLDPVSGKHMYVRYLHMKELSPFRYGDEVLKGNIVGYSGNTGTSTAPHLHLDVNTMTSYQWIGTNMTRSNTINPVNFFPDVSFPSHYYNIDYLG